MVIKEILMLGNPKLREVSSNINKFNDDHIKILQDLRDTLTYLQETKKIGRGIAAPQISVMKKLIFFQLPEKRFYMLNPKITWKSEDLINVWDSCFSFEVTFFVEIQRHKSIKVEYQDEKGNSFVNEYSDDLSELIQHEVDHLHGVLAIDHLKDVKKIIMRSEWERRFR